jgi:hypothetical protein
MSGYVSVLDGANCGEKMRIIVPGGPGMQIFSPDGTYGYVAPGPADHHGAPVQVHINIQAG